jgi:hypothetical protein
MDPLAPKGPTTEDWDNATTLLDAIALVREELLMRAVVLLELASDAIETLATYTPQTTGRSYTKQMAVHQAETQTRSAARLRNWWQSEITDREGR